MLSLQIVPFYELSDDFHTIVTFPHLNVALVHVYSSSDLSANFDKLGVHGQWCAQVCHHKNSDGADG